MTTIIDSQARGYIHKSETIDTRSTDERSHSVQGEETLKGFVSLATGPVPVHRLLHGQSVIIDHNTGPVLSSPPKGAAKTSVEQTAEIKKMADNVDGNDAKTLERMATLTSTVMSSHVSQTQTGNRTAESYKTSADSAIQTRSSTNPVRSQAAVEGGTDITAVGASGSRYVNVFGDMRLLELNNKLIVALNRAEAESNKSASKAVIRVVEAAGRAGQKGIDAEKQRLTGAITSGALGIALQGGTTFKATKALGNESASIKSNLKVATNLETGVRNNQNSIARAADNMLSKGSKLDRGVEAAMSKSHAPQMAEASELRNKHNVIQNKTQQTRTTTEFANQGIRSGQGMVEGGFGVQASQESRQAELARADQSVNNELSSTHQQTAKKSAEARAAAAQLLENILSNNNSAVSAIADRMR
ncbi:type III secretion system protein [Erwinia tasmaniensis]|uniref:Uncharacterized protein n=1 Tax=Erwinia tasmaniensis (strain DSM 17950 / CFBP 7177 / CIP 109463 / NCPPB 4357 / Et1/99) TaxID=465817 RepID=B2VG38_ERWT9|nr:type III secretion system protein [Erwinia tasmaniensis]CAO97727.1 Hypothetical protein ETA_26810 [Erwinia tasmaniensis Et1/99]